VRVGFIAKHRCAEGPIRAMCPILQVPSSELCECFGGPPSRRTRSDEKLTGLIGQRLEASDCTWDNSVMESIFSSLKTECVGRRH
jgi:hypothetical protein